MNFETLNFRAKKHYKKLNFTALQTVFENHRKSLIQHCERSEQRSHFERTKAH